MTCLDCIYWNPAKQSCTHLSAGRFQTYVTAMLRNDDTVDASHCDGFEDVDSIPL